MTMTSLLLAALLTGTPAAEPPAQRIDVVAFSNEGASAVLREWHDGSCRDQVRLVNGRSGEQAVFCLSADGTSRDACQSSATALVALLKRWDFSVGLACAEGDAFAVPPSMRGAQSVEEDGRSSIGPLSVASVGSEIVVRDGGTVIAKLPVDPPKARARAVMKPGGKLLVVIAANETHREPVARFLYTESASLGALHPVDASRDAIGPTSHFATWAAWIFGGVLLLGAVVALLRRGGKDEAPQL